jgi:hypothetical protein
MIKHLVVNGCSWTAGNELECDPDFAQLIASMGLHKQNPADPFNWNLLDSAGNAAATFDQLFDRFNWAGNLQQRLGAGRLTNLATGGGSNTRILRTTIDYAMNMSAEEKKTTLLVIGWTVSERDEIYVENSWQRWNATQPFDVTVDRQQLDDTAKIKRLGRFQEDYIAYVHSDYAALHRYFQQVYLLANLLDNLNINYFFFNALPAWWQGGDLAVDCDVANDFAKFLDWQESHSRFMGHSQTMFGFINNGKYPLAPYLHPLAQGHKAWAENLFTAMTYRNII